MTERNIDEMTLEDLALEYEKADTGYKDMKAASIIIQEEILSRMKAKEELAGDIVLTKCVRSTYNPTIEWAAEMGAVKTVVDNDRIKELVKSGIQVPKKEGKPYLLYSRAK